LNQQGIVFRELTEVLKMLNRNQQRMLASAILLSVTFVLVVGSPLYANQPADTAAVQPLPDGWAHQSPYLIPAATFVGGVIVALIASLLMRKRPSTHEKPPAASEAKTQAKAESK